MMLDRCVDHGAKSVFRILQGVALLFCLVPPVLVLTLSLFRDVFLNFPPHDFTLDLYGELFRSSTWRNAIVFSFKLGIPTSILTMLIVAPAALALERARIRGKAALQFLALLPLLLPATGYAVALYIIYLKLGWVGSYFPLMMAEAIVSAPVAFLIVRAALQRMPRQLDFVAMSLGASRARAMWDVSLNLLRPAMLVGMLFTLVHVFDDATYVTFLGGVNTVTVSKAIFDSLEYTLDPVVGALSASFTIFMTLIILTITVIRGGVGQR
jgi:putative spermidine/putrescine transport system permease protein